MVKVGRTIKRKREAHMSEASKNPINALSANRRKFVKLVAGGQTPGMAAKIAGYSSPSGEGWRLLRLDDVRAAIFAEQEKILTELGGKALATLGECLESESDAVRLKASEIVLKEIGRVKQRQLDQEQAENPASAGSVRNMSQDEYSSLLTSALKHYQANAPVTIDINADNQGDEDGEHP
jgi:hypothetical protein